MQSTFSQNNDYSALFSTSNYFSQNFYLVSDTFYSEFNFNDGEEYIFNILFNATNFNNPMTIVNRSDINQTDFEITIIDQDNIQVIINNTPIVFTTGGGSPWSSNLITNTWTNLKVTFTSASNVGIVIVQLKLVFAGQTFTMTASTQNTSVISNNLFFIGCQPFNGISLSPFNFFDGYIDYVTFTKNSPTPSATIIDLRFDNFSDDKKSFTDNIGKVFIIKPDPLFPLDEYKCLSLSSRPDFLCVNTHYPNIIGDKSKFENNLQLLIDFGFIPSYPRGGNAAYDLSGNLNTKMDLSNVEYQHQYFCYNGGTCYF